MNKLFFLLVVSVWIRHEVAASNFHHHAQDGGFSINEAKENRSKDVDKRKSQEGKVTATDVEKDGIQIGFGET